MIPTRGGVATALALAWAAFAGGCAGEGAPAASGAPTAGPRAPMAGSATDAGLREEVLGPFLAHYWRLPVAAQGEVPEGWSAAEASLDPALCGSCHPKQQAEWRTSLHAGAFSPGIAGQLVEGPLSRPASLRDCQSCHAPLAEQQPVQASGEPEPAFDPALRQQGIVCAACHVRGQRRFGPPRRPGLPLVAQEQLPHGGFTPRDEFADARFCATCHQFFRSDGPGGKPVQNTFVEWQRSPQAAEGRTCQSCHMPDRAHTWRGIHDPQLVVAAVDVQLSDVSESGDELRAVLSVTNRDVGHAFPTYVTPRVFLAVWQVDASHVELPGTRVEATIGRYVDFSASPAVERFDTRVLPGESFELEYRRPRDPRALALRSRVKVDPGHHYRDVYRGLLASLTSPTAQELIREALAREEHRRYVLAEERRVLPAR